jgi:hypothetical protein
MKPRRTGEVIPSCIASTSQPDRQEPSPRRRSTVGAATNGSAIPTAWKQCVKRLARLISGDPVGFLGLGGKPGPAAANRRNGRRRMQLEGLEEREMWSVTPVGSEYLVNTYTPGAQQTFQQTPQAVAMNPTTGAYVVVWSSQGQNTGGGWDVYFQLFNAAGVAQGPATLVDTPVNGVNQQYANVAMNSNGNFVVAWSSQLGGHWNVYAQQFNASGVAQGPAILVDTPTNADQEYATVAINSSNQFVVAWQGQQTGTWQIYANAFNPNGASFHAGYVTNTTSDQIDPDVTMDDAGDVVITWTGHQSAHWNVYAQMYSSITQPEGIFQVNTNTTDDQQFPAVALDAGGNFTITWSGHQNGHWNIRAQSYLANGAANGSNFQVNPSDGQDQQYSSIAFAGNGNPIITWSSNNQDGSGWGVYAQQVTPTGALLGSEFLVNTYTQDNQFYSSIAGAADGDVAIVWSSNNQVNNLDVFGQNYTTATSFVVTNTNDSGPGSLRQAILDVNAQPGPDTITFDIPGTGAETITLLSALPPIDNSTTVDATSQPGYAGTPLIEINAAALGAMQNAIVVNANNTTIEGLSIYGTPDGNGIEVGYVNGAVIQANYIGLTANGTVAGNSSGIVLTGATNAIVGGPTAADQNVIAGNINQGIRIETGSSGNVVEGNLIGTNAAGAVAAGNSVTGIEISDSANNTIGGTAPGATNVISGNGGPGIEIAGATSTGNLVYGNLIGTNASGTAALANAGDGVQIDTGASNNTIGGTAAGQANVIAYNTGSGVAVLSSTATGNAIEGNSIYSNSSLGIDLNGDGVTLNHFGSAAGPNDLQNFPVITSAVVNGANLTITGTLNSLPSENDSIDFYWSTAGDPSGYGQGQSYIGSTSVTTDSSGNATFSVTFVGASVPVLAVVSATATDSSGNTSEFSQDQIVNLAVNAEAAIVVSGSTFLVSEDNSVLRINSLTGAVVATYATGVANDGAVVGPDGSLYVSDYFNNQVLHFSPTGTLLGAFGSSELIAPQGLNFGPDGDLFVTCTNGPNNGFVDEFSPSGVFIGAFIAPGAGGLSNAKDIIWGPDGNAYVTSYFNSEVIRYNGSTGAFMNVFAAGSGGFEGLTFGPDGNLYVASYIDNAVYRFDGATGAPLGAFVSGVTAAYDVIFDPNGNLDVASQSNGQVLTFNGSTGALIGALVSGLTNPSYLTATTSLVTSETGTSASFTIALTSEPTAPVTIDLTVGSPTNGSLSQSSLTFDASDWNVPQTVTVTGLDSFMTSPSVTYQITGTATSSDANYNGMAMAPVVVTNTEASSVSSTSVVSSANPDVYGQAVTLTATVSGGPLAGTLTGTVTFYDGATALATVALSGGSAAFTASGLSAGNHNITVSYSGDAYFDASASSTLAQTVAPATLTVTANNASAAYGQPIPTFTDAITGFVNGDNASVVSGSAKLTTTATAGNGVGTYTITALKGSLSAANYTFAFTNGSLTITPALLTVTANDASKVYGQPNPVFGDAITGFVNGDSANVVSGSASLTSTATAGSGVGAYTIAATRGALSAANYTFAFGNGTLTVTPAILTITVNNASKAYGQPNPSFNVAYAGFVNGDGPSALGGSLAFDTSATATSSVGSYSVAPTGVASTNYSINFVNGVLTIEPKGSSTSVGDTHGNAPPAPSDLPSLSPPPNAPTVAPARVFSAIVQELQSTSVVVEPYPITTHIQNGAAGSQDVQVAVAGPAAPANVLEPTAAPPAAHTVPPTPPSPINVALPSMAAPPLRFRLDESSLVWEELDALAAQVEKEDLGKISDAVVLTTVVATAGYVLLNGRGLTLIVSLLNARPLWKRFDPLEILFAWEEEKKRRPKLGTGPEDETLQSIAALDAEAL